MKKLIIVSIGMFLVLMGVGFFGLLVFCPQLAIGLIQVSGGSNPYWLAVIIATMGVIVIIYELGFPRNISPIR